jgi:hypothetical protein
MTILSGYPLSERDTHDRCHRCGTRRPIASMIHMHDFPHLWECADRLGCDAHLRNLSELRDMASRAPR